MLGQRKVDDKSNEITAIPELLDLLQLKGCIVTIDAIGCQQAIAETIVEQEADYLLTLKGIQPELFRAVGDYFDALLDPTQKLTDFSYLRTVDAAHGRIETRQHWITEAISWLADATGRALWPGLRSIGMIHAQRRIGDQRSTFVRYYLASLPANAHQFAQAARAHWLIENQLHWSLDVTFHEDANRTRTDFAPQNLAIVRHIALNLLQQERSTNDSLKVKRLRAAWDQHYLLKLLSLQMRLPCTSSPSQAVPEQPLTGPSSPSLNQSDKQKLLDAMQRALAFLRPGAPVAVRWRDTEHQGGE